MTVSVLEYLCLCSSSLWFDDLPNQPVDVESSPEKEPDRSETLSAFFLSLRSLFANAFINREEHFCMKYAVVPHVSVTSTPRSRSNDRVLEEPVILQLSPPTTFTQFQTGLDGLIGRDKTLLTPYYLHVMSA